MSKMYVRVKRLGEGKEREVTLGANEKIEIKVSVGSVNDSREYLDISVNEFDGEFHCNCNISTYEGVRVTWLGE